MPVLAPDLCVSPPVLGVSGCQGFSAPWQQGQWAASLPRHPAGHDMAQQQGSRSCGFTLTGLISTAHITFEYLFSSIFDIWILNQANPPLCQMGRRGALVLLATQEEPQFPRSASCHHPGHRAAGCSCTSPAGTVTLPSEKRSFCLPHSVDTMQIPSTATEWMLEPE